MSPQEKILQQLFRTLSDVDRSAVIAFAEYLNCRQSAAVPARSLELPREISRPAVESVPTALKRLRQTYPMLDASDLLAEASDLLSQHLMLGRAASDVIDDMERLFQRHYQNYRDNPLGA